ncbi:MAG TPA: hypothetical protein VGW78_02205 [Candidatus Babeliales bacterium]|jgi:hypothetical protein|nr:hypothetical protein [Candidatus Babeliales bacterium]
MNATYLNVFIITLIICLLGGTIVYSMQKQQHILSPAKQTMYAWMQRNKPWLHYSSPGLALFTLSKTGVQKSSQAISNFYRTMWLKQDIPPKSQ